MRIYTTNYFVVPQFDMQIRGEGKSAYRGKKNGIRLNTFLYLSISIIRNVIIDLFFYYNYFFFIKQIFSSILDFPFPFSLQIKFYLRIEIVIQKPSTIDHEQGESSILILIKIFSLSFNPIERNETRNENASIWTIQRLAFHFSKTGKEGRIIEWSYTS